MIYLDSGATSFQKPPQVRRAVQRAMERCASPGRGGYPAAMRAAEAVFDCRSLAAALFDASAEQVVFTMNATHGLNLAIQTLVEPGDRVVISGFEHNAVTRPLHALHAEIVVAGRQLFDPADTLQAFAEAIDRRTRAVICTQVSNVFGYMLPIAEIAALCSRRQVPLIIDASQAAGMLPVSLRASEAAFIAMPGHKGLYGPQGTGILLCGRLPKSLLQGGTGSQSRLQQMPDFLPDVAEAGTHNVPGICGLEAGLRFVMDKTPERILEHEQDLLRRMTAQLEDTPGLHLYRGPEGTQSGVLSISYDDLDCEEVAARLARQGIAVRAGLHCAPLAHESAGTLEQGTVRLSFSCFNTAAEISRAAQVLKTMGN